MRAAAILAALAAAAPACAAEFRMFWPRGQDADFYALPFAAPPESDPRSGECLMVMSGAIAEGDYEAFLQVIYGEAAANSGEAWDGKSPPEYHISYTDDSELGQSLCLDSPGGSLPEALKMARLLLDNDVGLATKIMPGDRCESACAVLFMAGSHFVESESFYTGLQRELRPGGKLGVHAPSLTLPEGGSYSGAQVSRSFNIALAAARETFDFAFETDSDGKRIIPPYVFARFLETPPEEMYYLDTVGDALLSGFTVTGYEAAAHVDDRFVRTICDNAFMLDDGLFPLTTAPTWKSKELISARRIAEEFRESLPEKGRTWMFEDVENVSFADEAEIHGGDFYGRAAGYPMGYPLDALDCLVKVEGLGALGPQSLGAVETQWDAGEYGREIQVRAVYGSGYRPDQKPRPHEAWQQAAEEEGGGVVDTGERRYPVLISYPFGMKLEDLPAMDQPDSWQSAANPASCDALWHRRNLIFHNNGYCFGGARGIAAFGNDGCYTKSPDLSSSEAEEIRQIKQLEKDMAC
jgi:hypothetical protein